MTSSVKGVPRNHGRIYGNFYVTERLDGGEFSEADAARLEQFSAQVALTLRLIERAEEEQFSLFRAVVEHAPYGIVFFPAGGGRRRWVIPPPNGCWARFAWDRMRRASTTSCGRMGASCRTRTCLPGGPSQGRP